MRAAASRRVGRDGLTPAKRSADAGAPGRGRGLNLAQLGRHRACALGCWVLAKDIPAPDQHTDHQQQRREHRNAYREVDQRQAAGEDPGNEQPHGRHDDGENGAEPDHGHDQLTRAVRRGTNRNRIGPGNSSLNLNAGYRRSCGPESPGRNPP